MHLQLMSLALATSTTAGAEDTIMTGNQADFAWLIWVLCGLLVLVLQLVLTIWVATDAGRTGKSRGLWIPLCALPVLGLISVLIYLMSGTGVPQEVTQLRGENNALRDQLNSIGGQINELQTRLEEEQLRVPQLNDSGPTNDPGTRPLNVVPGRLLQLSPIGGPRHGQTETLPLTDHFGRPCSYVVGRDVACDINLPEREYESVSRHHCRLTERPDDGEVVVADLDTTNGTFILRDSKKARVTSRTPLKSGDRLFLGDVELQVTIIESNRVVQEILQAAE